MAIDSLPMKEGQPSQTAMLVAFRRFAAALDPVLKPLLVEPEEPFTGWFLEGHSPEIRQQIERLRTGGDHPFLRLMRNSAGQGGPLSILLRKRFVEEEVRAAFAGGIDQMVVFGAGYDTLGLRLAPSLPKLRVFELDFPATLAVKRQALESRQAVPPSLVLVPVDFNRESAEDRLRATPSFRPAAPTVFVAEAVLLYLEEPAIDALFASIHRLGGPGSRFIFSVLSRQAMADYGSAAQQAMQGLAQMGEPVKSTLDQGELPAFLEKRGFRQRLVADHGFMRDRYLAPLSMQDRGQDEATYFAVAERA
jgi:methyltransferase (TIGR00027 family)